MAGHSIAVVGAGIVGVCTALWLQRRGHDVLLIDRDEPGMGTSFGNACTIADYGCIPVNSPTLPRQLPRLLWSADSPLSFDPGYAIRHPAWMLGFLRNCSRKRVDDIIGALGSILSATSHGLDPLVEDTGSGFLFDRNGCLYGYATRGGFESSLASNRKREAQGVRFDILEGGEMRDLEPELKLDFYRGLLYQGARHVVNPKSLVDRFVEHFAAAGGNVRRAAVTAVEAGARLRLEGGGDLSVDRVVITAGAHSCRIRGAGLESLPLDTERGYHVQFAGRQSLLRRPVAWAEGGFYATPTSEGLRFAGTVEIAGLDRPPTPARFDYLTRHAKRMFDLEEQPAQTWIGFRPTFPDSLPVIGPSPVDPNVLFAFGHHHIGLTLAGITGRLVAELIDGAAPGVDLTPFSATRFSRQLASQPVSR